jgi:hypothetical protein
MIEGFIFCRRLTPPAAHSQTGAMMKQTSSLSSAPLRRKCKALTFVSSFTNRQANRLAQHGTGSQ